MESGVEMVPVGDYYCLCLKDSGAVCLLNDTASVAWRELASGSSLEEVAGLLATAYPVTRETALSDLRVWEAEWRKAGFITAFSATAELPSEENSDAPASAPAHQSTPTDDLSDAAQLVFGRNGAVTVTVRDPVLADLVQVVLRPLTPALDRLGPERQCRLEVRGDNGTYTVNTSERLICSDVARAWARHAVLHAVLTKVYCSWPASAVLHASAVSIGGRAVVIAGASGSGKSTLTAALVKAGALFLSDDLVPLAADGCEIGSFPVALSVKEGSWPAVAALYPELLEATEFETRGLRVRYLDLTGGKPQVEIGHQPVAIVFPSFEAGAGLSVDVFAPHDALTELLRTGTKRETTSMAPLARLCDQVPAWRFRYGDMNEAVQAIQRLAV